MKLESQPYEQDALFWFEFRFRKTVLSFFLTAVHWDATSSASPEFFVTRRDERGAVLLEALAALLIFSMAGMAALGLVVAGLNSEFDSRKREQLLATEERVLTAATLLTGSELDQRIGRHSVGELLVDVQRPEKGLYRLAVVQRESSQFEDLVTVVYRPEVRGAR